MIEKNNEYEVDIVDMGNDGEGIAKIKGYTTFIKGALKGEKAKIKITKANKDFGFARLLKILKNSDAREEPVCPNFGKCGACNLQHMSYETQLLHKENIVKNTLKKALGFDTNINNIIGMGIPFRYRNKAQYPVQNNKIGFYADRSHRLIENEVCYIQNTLTDRLAKDTFKILQKYNVSSYDEKTHKGCLRHIMTRIAVNANELMLVLITNEEKIKDIDSIINEIVELYPSITSIIQNINNENTNIIMGKECITLYGENNIVDILGDYKFKISPLSFYQVNPIQTEVLYNIAKEYAGLTGKENVFDLYCGIGTISIFVANEAKKVYGIEVVKEAIEDAKINAEMNKINNTEFIVGESEKVVPRLYEEGIEADVVFLDPPRKGCDKKLLETLIKMKAKKIVYISCNVATLGRDLKYLADNNYDIKVVQPLDLFPQTRTCRKHRTFRTEKCLNFNALRCLKK